MDDRYEYNFVLYRDGKFCGKLYRAWVTYDQLRNDAPRMKNQNADAGRGLGYLVEGARWVPVRRPLRSYYEIDWPESE